jgi:hypothetical protein
MTTEPTTSTTIRELLALAPSVIAVGSVYGLAASVFYQLAYFNVEGNAWVLASATLSDFLDRAVRPTILSALLAIGMVVSWYALYHRRLERDKDALFRTSVVFGVIIPGSILGSLALALFYDRSFAEDVMIFGFMGTYAAALLVIYWRVPTGKQRTLWLLGLAALLPVGGSVLHGMHAGLMATTCGRSDTILVEGDTVLAGHIAMLGERGVAIRENNGNKSLIPWDRVRQVTLGDCRKMNASSSHPKK